MKGLVIYASSRMSTETGAVYADVSFLPLTSDENASSVGFKPISVRSVPKVAEQLRELIRGAGPHVCELDLVPLVFGKQQSLELRDAKVLVACNQVSLTAKEIMLRKAA